MRIKVLLFALVCASAFAAVEPNAALAARIGRVESGLLPPARIAGAKPELWSLATRMKFYKVPGVSVAVIDHGAIEWARGYGVARAGEDSPVTPDTLFQAASISKPVAAAAALTLVDAGQLTLDADVNAALKSWKVPAAKGLAGLVTLRRLLSHTAGLTVHGFGGYAAGTSLPTLGQVLDGVPLANSAPIRITLPPGTQWRYSGGGYCVAQQLLLDVTGADFPTLMRERVLVPAGMAFSTFEQPLPALNSPAVSQSNPPNGSDSRTTLAAAGHNPEGRRIPGDAHIYPEMAAAGLWTTPSDLARFALALQHSLEGKEGFLKRETAEAMITPPLAGSDYGLGIGVKGEGEKLSLGHNGSNAGFRCAFVAYPRTGRGAIVMTNSDNGDALASEVLRALAHEYGWPDYQIEEKVAVPLGPVAFDFFVGRYDRESTVLTFSREGNHFYLRATDQPRREIFASSDHDFFLLNSAETYTFERDAAGNVTHLIRRAPSPQIFQPIR